MLLNPKDLRAALFEPLLRNMDWTRAASTIRSSIIIRAIVIGVTESFLASRTFVQRFRFFTSMIQARISGVTFVFDARSTGAPPSFLKLSPVANRYTVMYGRPSRAAISDTSDGDLICSRISAALSGDSGARRVDAVGEERRTFAGEDELSLLFFGGKFHLRTDSGQ